MIWNCLACPGEKDGKSMGFSVRKAYCRQKAQGCDCVIAAKEIKESTPGSFQPSREIRSRNAIFQERSTEEPHISQSESHDVHRRLNIFEVVTLVETLPAWNKRDGERTK